MQCKSSDYTLLFARFVSFYSAPANVTHLPDRDGRDSIVEPIA